MMPMDPKKLIHRFSWKRSQSAVFSHLHKIDFADMVGFRVHGHILCACGAGVLCVCILWEYYKQSTSSVLLNMIRVLEESERPLIHSFLFIELLATCKCVRIIFMSV